MWGKVKQNNFFRCFLTTFFSQLIPSPLLVEKLVDLYKKYEKTLQAQLLQIFVKKESFNQLGYCCFAGGVPVFGDSATMLDQINIKAMQEDSKPLIEIVNETLRQAFAEKNFII